ncbi:hypothetical protein [Streptomyces sp. NPDC058847]|uniref:hypothetical protein n=1 Tax=Streptomyces sp. NPDC058847 TaxID=3346649 RepID=UPI00368F8CD3
MDSTERLGLRYETAEHHDARTREDLKRLAALLALIIVSKRTSSDLAKLARTEPLNIAAEMEWNLMPPGTYADGRVIISASMGTGLPDQRVAMPTSTPPTAPLVHLTFFDAGHDTAAGLSAALALGACRAPPLGADLIAKAQTVEAALIEQYEYKFGVDRFTRHHPPPRRRTARPRNPTPPDPRRPRPV